MEWVWCKLCKCPALICPKCGNNCCSGGSRLPGCPDNCQEAYKMQQEAVDDGTAPKREECSRDLSVEDIFNELVGEKEIDIRT